MGVCGCGAQRCWMRLEMGIQAVVSLLTWVLGTQLSPLQEQHTCETAESYLRPPEFSFKIGLVILSICIFCLSLQMHTPCLPICACKPEADFIHIYPEMSQLPLKECTHGHNRNGTKWLIGYDSTMLIESEKIKTH